MSEMTIEEIISVDMKNYPSGHHTIEDAINKTNSYIIEGKEIYRHGNTFFVTHEIDDGIEYHSVNAEKGLDLVRNVNSFLQELHEQGYKFAVTYYDNPKILKLVEMFVFPQETVRIDDGQFRTYKTTARL